MSDAKFCCCVKLDTGCIILGITTFLMASTGMTIGCLHLICATHTSFLQNWHDFELDTALSTTVTVIAMCVASVWIGFSILFIRGVIKKNANYVISYFLFSCFLCLLFSVVALLQMVAQFWIASGITIVLTLTYMRCLVAVYKMYGNIVKLTPEDRQQLFDHEWDIQD